jgi:ABC-type dipeptide/oligopeptide/nickel transport system permease subunit
MKPRRHSAQPARRARPSRRAAVSSGASSIRSWLVYPPALILIITVVAFNMIGDAIRDSLDVHLRRQ